MALASQKSVLDAVERICKNRQVRLTPKRRAVFASIAKRRVALSAYEIAEHLKAEDQLSIPVMSVYRILDFLTLQGFVHKIFSINKYAACSHVTCSHQHDMPRLAICCNCQRVDEIAASTAIKADIEKGLESIHFKLQAPHLELMGLCSDCGSQGKNFVSGTDNHEYD